ncbi:MAG: PDZ domain-containing protein, partial [Pirellulales bacterium]
LDGVRSQYDIGVNEGMSEPQLTQIEQKVKGVEQQVESLSLVAQDAKTHRQTLQKLLEQAQANQTAAAKALADHEAEIKRLKDTLAERSETYRKKALELPVIDAFGRPLKIDNIWLPQLTWNNNFRDVARFDRCTTCHQGIEKTGPGSAVNPGYATIERLQLTLTTPAAAPELTDDQFKHIQRLERVAQDAWFYERAEKEAAVPEQKLQYRLVQAYGLELAPQGIFDANDVTVTVVEPKSAAAKAQLEPGDVIEQINDVKLIGRDRAVQYLLENVEWGKPLTLHVRRGIPEPFNSHPRLDLFVGSLSPHKAGEMGCTACHDGQGSATEFKWVSHTPNTPRQAEEWHRDYGWF